MSLSDEQLRDLLRRAQSILDTAECNDAWSHLSHGEFRQLLAESIAALEIGKLNSEKANSLWLAFAPTSDWDDMIGNV
ncbi:MAG: hypothetical protein GY906_33085, partial [bacterium]|nr:hypothetical protein [bacterium]